jgi:DNA-3-methyladenine glycosylase II
MVTGDPKVNVGRIITSNACVAEGATFLASKDQCFAKALIQIGELPLRLKGDGFEPLLDAIVGQQISVASADSIWTRLQTAKLTTQTAVRMACEEDLLACGLSRPKVRYAKALAESSLDYSELRGKAYHEVLADLTAINGIGKWTADIYALSSLGRADVFPAGDLALQESTRVLFELEARPTEKQMAEIAEQWSPWRSVAARLLWAYYRIVKEREGIRT